MALHDRWVQERKHEHYYKLAKKLNYRSRASFKLIQIDDRFRIFRVGDSVVDLGASPGGWLQVAKERVGVEGKVIGVDLRSIRPLEGVTTIIGDITEDSTMRKLSEAVGGKVDVILSDMAPNIGGSYSTDHARSVDLCMHAVSVSDRILKKGGKMVVKVFMGDMTDSLIKELESRFMSVKIHSPEASRDASSEVYIISKGFLAPKNVKLKDVTKEEKSPEFTPKGGNI
jgi:23S rRNA (uridine2552-2'-O)-methyltransferase